MHICLRAASDRSEIDIQEDLSCLSSKGPLSDFPGRKQKLFRGVTSTNRRACCHCCDWFGVLEIDLKHKGGGFVLKHPKNCMLGWSKPHWLEHSCTYASICSLHEIIWRRLRQKQLSKLSLRIDERKWLNFTNVLINILGHCRKRQILGSFVRKMLFCRNPIPYRSGGTTTDHDGPWCTVIKCIFHLKIGSFVGIAWLSVIDSDLMVKPSSKQCWWPHFPLKSRLRQMYLKFNLGPCRVELQKLVLLQMYAACI